MRRTTAAAGVAALTVALAACGTRLPDRDFVVAQGGPGVAGGDASAPGDAGTGPTASGAAGAAGGTGVSGASSGAAGGAAGSGSAGGAAGARRGPGAAAAAAASANPASDVGVTPTTITLGTISSRTNPFDPAAFVGPQYGAQAFVDEVNRNGGINGRRLQLLSCDDHGDGGRNNECVHQLVDTDRVFALVSNAIFTYAGARYVQSKGVPDIGSQPIDTAYDAYSHLWDLYGESYPRNGTVGYDGKLEGGTEVYRFFKTRFANVPLKAGVVYYNQAQSQRYADNLIQGLKAEGYTVVDKEVNFALPDYDSAVLDMRSQGVQYVYDVLDAGGNQNLCASMDSNGLSDQITAKVTTTQSWVASVATQYAQAPKCRNKIWATGNTLNYEDVGAPPVAAFRAAMSRLHTDGPNQLSEWALEGWAGAQWLADAMASCGANLTRTCVEAYMGRNAEYTGHGLLTARDFVKYPPRPQIHSCINVARWQDGAHGGRGGWVTQVPDMNTNCFDVKTVYYTP
jgi:branched-chain amino acid transport system substrate-binding protein